MHSASGVFTASSNLLEHEAVRTSVLAVTARQNITSQTAHILRTCKKRHLRASVQYDVPMIAQTGKRVTSINNFCMRAENGVYPIDPPEALCMPEKSMRIQGQVLIDIFQ